jgi:hypothetical protein
MSRFNGSGGDLLGHTYGLLASVPHWQLTAAMGLRLSFTFLSLLFQYRLR